MHNRDEEEEVSIDVVSDYFQATYYADLRDLRKNLRRSRLVNLNEYETALKQLGSGN